MTGHLAQRPIHRITVFDREYLIFGELQAAVTFDKFLSHRQEFHSKLRARFLSMVDNPHIAPFIRMNIVVGEFLHIGVRQSRETAEHEYIFDDGRFVIGDIDVHHGTQFRFRQETSVAVCDSVPVAGERIGSDPSVPEGRIGHQLQFLDRSMDTAGEHITDSREVNHVLFDKFPLQFFERYIIQFIFVLEECGQIAACTGVVSERSLRMVFTHTLLGKFFQVVVECLQQELTSLGILALYYFVLYLLRGRLEKEITFKVRKTS